MVFSSYRFIFAFFPIVFTLYFLLNKLKFVQLSRIMLIIASFYFFYCGSGWFLGFFIATTIVNFGFSKLILIVKSKSIKRLVLTLGILENLSLLGYYKYFNFAVGNLNRFLGTELSFINVVLPIGISFFSFQIIAYLADSYYGKTKDYSFMEYMLFITFFPQLIIGPIARHQEIIPQFRNSDSGKINIENIKKGLFIFSIGIGKKVILADPLIVMTKELFNYSSALSPFVSVIALFANLFSFYFDFSGYADMAIGLGLCFNIVLPENFNSPLKARNFQDYWQRRHMTLTRFLTEFVFRRIFKPNLGIISFCFATMMTFFISGIWHGAGWNYVIWGLLHGTLVSIVGVFAVYSSKKHMLPKLPSQILTVFALLLVGGLYICNGTSHYIDFMKNLLNFGYYSQNGMNAVSAFKFEFEFIANNFYALLIMAVCFVISFFFKNTRQIAEEYNKKAYLPILAGMLFVVCMFMLGETSEFIYFRF